MIDATFTVRALGALSAGALALGALSGCAPSPEPSPTKTALFASDEEAFAAAEETYRAYTEASNARRNGDQSVDPQDFLTGEALESHIDSLRALDEAGLRVVGDVSVVDFRPMSDSVRRDGQSLSAVVCLDLANARTLNSDGDDVTPSDRPQVIALGASMIWVEKAYAISREFDEDNATCAD